MGAPPPCFFPWNPSHIGASFKDESLASLADGTLVDAYYGEPVWQAPVLAAAPLRALRDARETSRPLAGWVHAFVPSLMALPSLTPVAAGSRSSYGLAAPAQV